MMKRTVQLRSVLLLAFFVVGCHIGGPWKRSVKGEGSLSGNSGVSVVQGLFVDIFGRSEPQSFSAEQELFPFVVSTPGVEQTPA